LLREKVIALMKSMPKALRVKFVPVPEHADRAIAALRPPASAPSLHDELAYALGKMIGEPMDRNAFAPADINSYLRMNFRIVDDNGEVVLVGRDLDAIRRKLGIEARKTFQHQPPSEFHRDDITSWDFPDLPDRVEVRKNAMTLQGYPALIDAGKSAALRLFDSPELARTETRAGVRRLLMLQLREEVKWLSRKLPGFEQMQMNYATVGSADDLKADLVEAIIDRALFGQEGAVRTREQFLARAQLAWKRMNIAADEIGGLVSQILEKYQALNFELSKVAPPALIGSYQDMRRHLASLIHNGFIIQTPPPWFEQYPRFLSAIEIRLRKLRSAGLNRDQAAMAEIAPLIKQYHDRGDANARDGVVDPELETYRWMLEELRVQMFAQELKTSIPVSVKRLAGQWAKVKTPPPTPL
jgi:ATP-dependent helicase HrpA